MTFSSKSFDQFKELIQETGEFIRAEARSFSVDKVEKKGWNDLVSYVDKTAEEMLIKGCSQLIPGAGFIGEESGTQKGSNDYTWIIDPLDGPPILYMDCLPIRLA